MLINPDTPTEIALRKSLCYMYEFWIAIALRDQVSKDDIIYNLVCEKEQIARALQSENLTSDQIKDVLKKAADEEAEHLALVGISPEELY